MLISHAGVSTMLRVHRGLAGTHVRQVLLVMYILVAGCAGWMGSPAMTGLIATSAADGPGEKRYVVILEDASAVNPSVIAERHSSRFGTKTARILTDSVPGYAAEMTPAEANAIAKQPGVAAVGLDPVGRPAGQTMWTGLQRIFAAADSSENNEDCDTGADPDVNQWLDIDCLDDQRVDVDIAVLDTPIDPADPELNIAAHVNCFEVDPEVGCETGVGTVDDSSCFAEDHGAVVSEVIAGIDNGSSQVGIAAGARISSVAVADNDVRIPTHCESSSQPFYMSDVIAGVEWVTENSVTIEVANLSMRFPVPGPEDTVGQALDQAFEQAIDASVDAGVVYVAAAGNEGAPAADSIPAKYDKVITVTGIFDIDGAPGGLAEEDTTCDWTSPFADDSGDDTNTDTSSYGPYAGGGLENAWSPGVDIAAPGPCTSTAAAMVSGSAALLASVYNPAASKDASRVAAIRTALLAAANPHSKAEGGYDDARVDEDPETVDREPLLDVSDEDIFDPRPISTYEPIPGAEPIVEVRDADTEQPCGEVMVIGSQVSGGCVVNDLFSSWYGLSAGGYTIFSCGGGSIPIWLDAVHVASDGTFAVDASDIDTSCAGSFITGTPCHTEPSDTDKEMLHAAPWTGRFYTSSGAPRAYLGLCIELGSAYQDWIDGITASVTSEAPLAWSFLTSYSRDILGPSNGFQTAAWTSCCTEDPEIDIVWEAG